MKTIDFVDHEHDPEYEPEPFQPLLLITLVTGKRLRMTLGLCSAAKYAASIVQTLVQGLRDNDCHTRRFAAEGLGRLGPDGVQHLRNAAKHYAKRSANEVAETLDERVQKDAREALLRIEEAVPHLQQAAKDEDEAVRRAATDALQRIQLGRA